MSSRGTHKGRHELPPVIALAYKRGSLLGGMTYSLNIQRLALRERGEAYHVSVAQLAHRLSTSPALAALTAQRLRFLQPYLPQECAARS
jgi:hypothetical protein